MLLIFFVLFVFFLCLVLNVACVSELSILDYLFGFLGEVYSTKHYVIMFASDLWQVGGFFRVLWFPPTINLRLRYNWDIIESGIEHYNPNANPIIKRNNVYTEYLFVCDIGAFRGEGSMLLIFFVLFVFVLCLVLNVACVSGLSILDYLFGFL
jgi:hypothetical protein